MKIRGLLIDPTRSFCDFVELEDSLDTYYQELHCRLIQIITCPVGGRKYSIICDEEAKVRNIPKVSTYIGNPTLINAIFVCKRSGSALKSINQFDEGHLKNHIKRYGSGAILMDMEP